MALRNYGSLRDYARIMPPIWGGHPANDLLATATALAYANNGKADDRYQRRLAEQARTLVAELVTSQAENGSWNSGITSEFTTARAFWALIEARNAGIAVNKASLDKTADFLLNQLKNLGANDSDSKAIVLHALSTDKRADSAACNRLYRDRNSLGSATLALLTRAFYNLDRKEIALLERPNATAQYVSRGAVDKNGDLFFGNVGMAPVGIFKLQMPEECKNDNAHLPIRMWG